MTNISNPLPFKFTVSKPTCTNISTPLLVLIPNACLLFGIITIIPSTGETTILSDGIIAKPSPIILVENTLSGTSSIFIHFPSIGETIPPSCLFINLNILTPPFIQKNSLIHYPK